MSDSTIRRALFVLLMVVVAGVSVRAQIGEPAQVGAPGQAGAPGSQPAPGPAQGAGPGPAVAAANGVRDENTISLNSLLEQVAANEEVEFIVDPRARAVVRLVPAIDEPDLNVLRSVLRVHGYMAVEIEGRIHIVPDAMARQMPTRLLQRDDPSVSDDEIVTRILTVDTGNAAELIPILRPMLPVSAHFAAWTSANKIVIVDRYDNVRRITEVIAELTD